MGDVRLHSDSTPQALAKYSHRARLTRRRGPALLFALQPGGADIRHEEIHGRTLRVALSSQHGVRSCPIRTKTSLGLGSTSRCRPRARPFVRSLSDCGWRSPPRSVHQETAASDDCKLNGIKSEMDPTDPIDSLLLTMCLDNSEYYSPPNNRLQGDATTMKASDLSCGRGTDITACGSMPIYIAPDSPGGCHETCDITLARQFIDPPNFDPLTTCSDGGHGSFRIRMRMPSQTIKEFNTTSGAFTDNDYKAKYHFQTYVLESSYKDDDTGRGERALGPDNMAKARDNSNYYYWEFLCPFGSQVGHTSSQVPITNYQAPRLSLPLTAYHLPLRSVKRAARATSRRTAKSRTSWPSRRARSSPTVTRRQTPSAAVSSTTFQ